MRLTRLAWLFVACTFGCSVSDEEDAETTESAVVTPRGEIVLELPATGADLSAYTAFTVWQKTGAMIRQLRFDEPLSVPAGRTCIVLSGPESATQVRCGLNVPSGGRLTVPLSYARFSWDEKPPVNDVLPKAVITPPGGLLSPSFIEHGLMSAPYEASNWRSSGHAIELRPGESRARLVIGGSFTASYPGLPTPARRVKVPDGVEHSADVTPADFWCTLEVDIASQIVSTPSDKTFCLLNPAGSLLWLRELGGRIVSTSPDAYACGGSPDPDGVSRIRLTPKTKSDRWTLHTSGQTTPIACVPGQTTKVPVRYLEVPASGDFERYEILELDGEKPLTFYLGSGGSRLRAGGRPGTGVFVRPGSYMVRTFRNVEILEERIVQLF